MCRGRGCGSPRGACCARAGAPHPGDSIGRPWSRSVAYRHAARMMPRSTHMRSMAVRLSPRGSLRSASRTSPARVQPYRTRQRSMLSTVSRSRALHACMADRSTCRHLVILAPVPCSGRSQHTQQGMPSGRSPLLDLNGRTIAAPRVASHMGRAKFVLHQVATACERDHVVSREAHGVATVEGHVYRPATDVADQPFSAHSGEQLPTLPLVRRLTFPVTDAAAAHRACLSVVAELEPCRPVIPWCRSTCGPVISLDLLGTVDRGEDTRVRRTTCARLLIRVTCRRGLLVRAHHIPLTTIAARISAPDVKPSPRWPNTSTHRYVGRFGALTSFTPARFRAFLAAVLTIDSDLP